MTERKIASAFFSYQLLSLFFASIAYFCCYMEPTAIGSGIPEIKAFLNGVNLSHFVKVRLVCCALLWPAAYRLERNR